MGKIKVAILFGGISTEHEVSRMSVSCVVKEIDRNVHDIILLEITKDNRCLWYSDIPLDTEEFCREILLEDNKLKKQPIALGLETFREFGADVVFPLIHGTNGEDGTLQGFLELCRIPYVGCGVLSSSLCMDKTMAKTVLAAKGIPQAGFLFCTCDDIWEDIVRVEDQIENAFSYPLFIKPSCGGSSVGVVKVKDRKTLQSALLQAASLDRKILAEEWIQGREIECAVHGNHLQTVVSQPGEVVASNEFYDYDAKYIDGKSLTIVPADIPPESVQLIRKYALEAFRVLDCHGLARVDFFLKKNGSVILNEVNTIPGFTPISMYPKLMQHSGMSYRELIHSLIRLALDRAERYVFTLDYKKVEGR